MSLPRHFRHLVLPLLLSLTLPALACLGAFFARHAEFHQ